MKRCPNCERFGIKFDETIGHERCIWRNCTWINIDNIDVDKVKHPNIFRKFINAIKRKMEL